MKFLIVLCAAVALASAGKLTPPLTLPLASRSISSNVVDAIESLKDQMPCGFEKFGIPPLAPLKIQHREVNVETTAVEAHGETNQLRVDGLNEFDIVEMRVNPILSKITFKFSWPSIRIQNSYDLAALLHSYGITVNIKGAGDMSLALDDLVVKGTIKYSLGIISQQLKLKELKIVISIGGIESKIKGILGTGVFNNKMNEFIEEFIELTVNDNQQLITQTIEDTALPIINNAADGMSLADLIAAVVGGGGGGDGEEPTMCVPPTD